MCEVPTLREELDRKVVEALAEMTINHDKGMMSTESYYQALTAINLCTNGLIDEEVSLVISDNLENNVPASVQRRILVSDGVTVVLARALIEDFFTMTQIVAGTVRPSTKKSFSDADDPISACTTAIEKLITQLEAKGFTEVK